MDHIEPLRVLIVEDYSDTAEMLAKWVELAGHSAHVCRTGFQAILEAPGYRPQVIFLDIGLPDMYGWEVARALRQDPAVSRSHIVAVTAYSTEEDRHRSEEAGIDEFLGKPVRHDAIDAVLAHV